MKNQTINLVVAVAVSTALLSGSAWAKDKITMPADAKLLSMVEIIAAYGGKKVIWTHPNGDGVNGFALFDTAITKASGEWHGTKAHGTFESKTKFEGDNYCYTTTKLDGKMHHDTWHCAKVYAAGGKYFENDSKSGKNMSVNTIAQ